MSAELRRPSFVTYGRRTAIPVLGSLGLGRVSWFYGRYELI